MLSLYGSQRPLCDGLSRRDFLQVGSLGAVGLSLADLAALEAQAAAAPGADRARG